MAELPEHLLRRSAEAKAKALGISVEEAMAQLKGEAPPSPAPAPTPAPEPAAVATPEPAPAPVAVAVAGDPSKATAVRPVAPPVSGPEGVRTQRLLTVVKAKAIQQAKAEPQDKVNTWPHLMIIEFAALLAVTGILIVLSTILQAPLLEAANFNVTPNPSKAPWYFLGLQELLSYFDPAIAGVSVPLITGLFGLMAVPYIDKNPSTKPADRKVAIFLFTFFLMGSATLTMFGVFFRGPGFNFVYPWHDGIFFDDLKDWVHFENLGGH